MSTRTRAAAALVAGALLIAGVATWVVTSGPGTGSTTTDAASHSSHLSDEGAARRATDDPDPARRHVERAPPASPDAAPSADGNIHVVGPDGAPARAEICTTPGREWPGRDAVTLGYAGDDGVLSPDRRKTQPLAFVWALGHGLIAGPEPFDEAGQILTLGPGCTVEVQVRRPDGSPIAGVVCRGVGRPSDESVTDAAGNALLTGFAPARKVGVFADVWGGGGESAIVTPTADGSPAVARIVLDPGGGPLVVLTVSTDGPPLDDVRLELVGTHCVDLDGIRTGGPPLLVSLRCYNGAPATISARALGTRVASRTFAGLEPDSTTHAELVLRAGGVPLRGRVLGTDGAPAADVRVDTVDRALSRHGGSRTDADGWFDVRPEWLGQEIRAVRAKEASSAAVALVGDTDELVLRLESGASVEGVVRDAPSGVPVPGARVGLWFDNRGFSDWQVTTDDLGRYRASGIPAGSFLAVRHIASDRASDTAAAEERSRRISRAPENVWIREGVAYRVEGTETIRHDLVVVAHRGAECAIRIRYPEGVAVPKEIEIAHAQSDSERPPDDFARPHGLPGDAQPRLFLCQGTHRFRVTAPGLVGESGVVRVVGDSPLRDIDVEMRRRRRVLVRIVDSQGVPVERADVDVRLWIRGPGGANELVLEQTDPTGVADLTAKLPTVERFAASGIVTAITLDGPGIFEDVEFSLDGAEWRRRLTEELGDPWVIDVPLVEPPTAEIRVVDLAGRSVAGVPLVWWSSTHDSESQRGVSGTDGRVGVPRLGDRDEIEIRALGDWIGVATLTLSDDDQSEPTLIVDRRRTVRVRLVEPGGAAIAQHALYWSVPGGRGRTNTDAEGFFGAELPVSDTTFRVNARDHWPRDDVRVLAGIDEVEVVLQPLHPVTLEFEFPPGFSRPRYVEVRFGASNVQRWLEIPQKGPAAARVDLPRLPLDVSVDIAHPRFAGVGRYDGTGDTVTVRVEPVALRSVVLAIVDEEGRPLGMLQVAVHDRFDRRVLDERVTTDTTGRVTVRVPNVDVCARVTVDGRESADWFLDADEQPDAPITVRLPRTR